MLKRENCAASAAGGGSFAKKWAVKAMLAGAALAAMPAFAPAAIIQWDGGGTGGGGNNWSNANNWGTNTAPASAVTNDLEFGTIPFQGSGRTTAVNDINASFNVNSITFGSVWDTTFTISSATSPSAYQIEFAKDGDQPSINQGASSAQIINSPLKIGASAASLTLTGAGSGIVTLGAIDVNGKALIKSGTSSYLLTGALGGVAHNLTINDGTFAVGTGGSIANTNILLRGGVLATNNTVNGGSFTRTLGTTFNWGAGGGGFAAYDGALTVDLAGTSLMWNTTNYLPDGAPLILGSAIANNVVTYQDGINLGNTMSSQSTRTREIRVNDNAASTADYARILGDIIQTGGTKSLNKTGDGLLELAGANSYDGNTTVTAGTLLITGTTISDGGTTVAATLGGAGTLTSAVTATGANAGSRSVIAPGNVYSTAGGTTLGTGVGTFNVIGNTTLGNFSTLAIDVNGATADKLNVTGTLNTSSASNLLALNMTGASLGKYTIAQATTLTAGANTAANGGFASITGLDSAYRLNTTATLIELIHKATIAIDAAAADPTIITGGATAITGHVANIAPVDSDALSYTLSSPQATGLPGGTLNRTAGDANAAAGALFNGSFTSTTLGTNSVLITATGAASSNNPQVATVNVNVLDHAVATFNGALDPDALEITFNVFEGQSDSHAYSLSNLAGSRAGLVFTSVNEGSGDDGFAESGYFQNNISGFGTLLAGNATGFFDVFFDASTLSSGVYQTSYTLNMSDQNLPGALPQVLTINVTGNVISHVPEPAGLGLLSLGLLGLARRRRR